MSDHRLSLPFWEGFLVSSLDVVGSHLQIRLVADPTCPLICSHCGAEARCIHETTWRIVRDLPMAGLPVFLSVAVNRLQCRTCNRCCTQLITWLDRHARVSRRLAQFVAHWCEKLPIAHVCELTGLHWGTIHQIHRQDLERKVAALPPPQPTRLVMDEFSLFKGHRYATVVLDADIRLFSAPIRPLLR
jgi:transposase